MNNSALHLLLTPMLPKPLYHNIYQILVKSKIETFLLRNLQIFNVSFSSTKSIKFSSTGILLSINNIWALSYQMVVAQDLRAISWHLLEWLTFPNHSDVTSCFSYPWNLWKLCFLLGTILNIWILYSFKNTRMFLIEYSFIK